MKRKQADPILVLPAAIMVACATLAMDAGLARSNDGPLPAWECKGVFVRQAGPSSVPENSLARYEIRVTNEGDCILNDGTVTDYIPRRSVYRSAEPVPAQQPPEIRIPADPESRLPVDQVLWKEIELLPGGDEVRFAVEVEVQGPPGRIATNTACFEHPRAGRVCSEFETYVKPRP